MFDVLVINNENRLGRLIQREVAALDEDLLFILLQGNYVAFKSNIIDTNNTAKT